MGKALKRSEDNELIEVVQGGGPLIDAETISELWRSVSPGKTATFTFATTVTVRKKGNPSRNNGQNMNGKRRNNGRRS